MWKSWLLYFLFLLASFAFYLFDDQTVSLWLLWMLLLVPVVSLLFLIFTVFSLQISLSCPVRSAGKKADIPLHLSVRNRGIFPVGRLEMKVSYQNSFCSLKGESILTLSAAVFSRQEFSCRISSEHYGKLLVKAEEFRVWDLFGLFSFKRRVKGEESIFVLPSLRPPAEGSEGLHGQEGSGNSLLPQQEAFEVSSLREYRPGDRMNRIHWKLSSRTPEWMVKESAGEERRFLLLLDLPEEDTLRDDVLEVFSGLSQAMQESDASFEIIWNQGTGLCRKRFAGMEESPVQEVIASVVCTKKPEVLKGFCFLESFESPAELFCCNGLPGAGENVLKELCQRSKSVTMFAPASIEPAAFAEVEWVSIPPGGAFEALSDWSR